MQYYIYDTKTELGVITLYSEGEYITGLYFGVRGEEGEGKPDDTIRRAAGELDEYLHGKRREFTVKVKAYGTEFQKTVWDALTNIRYGETKSYGQIAREIGKPSASRAVGGANHNNPVSVFVPCHRVVGADGSLTGYGGGIEKKKFLLSLEKTYLQMGTKCKIPRIINGAKK